MSYYLDEVKIIDRSEEERNKNFEQAFADGLQMSMEDLRFAVKEICEFHKKRDEAEKQGIILEWCHSVDVGRVLLGGSWEKLIIHGDKNE